MSDQDEETPAGSVSGMLEVFDVTPAGDHRFVGVSLGGTRRVVDASQLLSQAIVVASKSFPRHTVRSAQAVFLKSVDVERELWFEVDRLHEGRTFAGAVVAVGQGDRRCASVTVLLDVEFPDVIRHAAPPPEVARPQDAVPCAMPMRGRQLRLVDLADPNDPAECGPPFIDAWLHYDPIPTRPDLAKALVAHFTGHLSISTTMRAHEGFGTSMAHDSVSTAVMGISITFHEPVAWAGWILYHHESTQVGAGMSHVRGQVFTEEGVLIASFTQDGMIRAFAGDSVALSKATAERL
jgi:acyl-CoA thioesterase-2